MLILPTRILARSAPFGLWCIKLTRARARQSRAPSGCSGSVYRYLLGALRDRDAADDLFQEFALRFLRGAFRNADPQRGRFRDFVKTALYHLIVDHQNKKLKVRPPLPLGAGGVEPARTDPHEFDQEFTRSWRDDVLGRAWAALQESSQGGTPYYLVLRLRSEQPELSSTQLAQRLIQQLGRAVTADWVRQTLRRAREQFANLLLDELACSLEMPTRDRLEQELIDLNLLNYCQQALDHWRPACNPPGRP
jgi:RNA polymerase sigma-70 factor (ECF subfamily)